MRPFVGEALDRARSLSQHFTKMTSRVGFGSAPGNPLGLTGQAAGVGVGRAANLTQHTEQLRHYTGWVAAAIGPVAKRIARQPARLARVKAAHPAGDTPGAPPAPTVPGGQNPPQVPGHPDAVPARPQGSKHHPRAHGGRAISARLKPWEMPSNSKDIARRIWFRRHLPGYSKSYFETAELIESHPFLDAIDDPNPVMVRWSLIFVTVASLLLTGKAFWWIKARERDGEPEAGQPGHQARIEIWPIPSNWVSPVHKADKLYDHWEVKPEGTIDPTPVPIEQIVYFYLPDPANPLGAYSTLQSQARAVVSDEAIAEAQRRGFANGVFPGVALIVGRQPDINGAPGDRPVLNKEQRAQLVTAFKQAYRGVYNTDEPIILDQLIQDIKRITNTPREMDFMESGKYTKERITQGFGVNPISMGQVEGANRASSATADDHLCQNTVNPLIELISETVTAWFNPLFAPPGQKYLFFLEEAYAVDPDSEREDWALLAQNGAAQRNELRAALKGLPPIVDGDQCLVASGMTPIDCRRLPGGVETSGWLGRSYGADDSAQSSEPDPIASGGGWSGSGLPDTPSRPQLPDYNNPAQADSFGDVFIPFVEDVRQELPYDCGATEARGVAMTQGLAAGGREDFLTELRTEDATGTTPDHIFNYFSIRGCQPYRRDKWPLDLVRREVARGRLVMCVVQYMGDGDALGGEGSGEESGHWVTVNGFTRETIRYHDPLDGQSEIAAQKFLDNWHDRGADGRAYVRFGISVGSPPGARRSVRITNRKAGSYLRRQAGAPEALLDLPDIRQTDDYSCGAAIAMSAGRGFGVGPEDLETWKTELHTNRASSTQPEAIADYLQSLGLQVESRDKMTIDDLRNAWMAGRPVLCPIQEYGTSTKPTSQEYGHWVATIGVALGHIFVQDPSADNVLEGEDSDAAPGRVMITEDKWNQVWHDTLGGRDYIQFGIIVGPPTTDPKRSVSSGVRVTDSSGHEHGDHTGRFVGHGGGGGGGGDDHDKPKPDHGGQPAKPRIEPGHGNSHPPGTPKPEHVETAEEVAKLHPEEAKKPGFFSKLAGVAKAIHGKVNEFILNHATTFTALHKGAELVSNLITTPGDIHKNPALMEKFSANHSSGLDSIANGTGGLVPGQVVASVAAAGIVKGWAKIKGLLGHHSAAPTDYTPEEIKAAAETLSGLCQAASIDLSVAEAKSIIEAEAARMSSGSDGGDQLDDSGAGKDYHCKAKHLTLKDRLDLWERSHKVASRDIKDAVYGFLEAERERIMKALPGAMADKSWQAASPITKDVDPADDGSAGTVGDEDRDAALTPLLDRLAPVASMTRRLVASVREPLTAVALEGAAQEHDLLAPAQRSELDIWLADHGPAMLVRASDVVDRKPLAKPIRTRVNAYLDDMVEDPYWEGINKTTRLKIARAVRRGLANNETVRDIEARIRVVLSPTANTLRADLISKTEATAALNIGFQAAREHYGPKYVKGKKWATTPDDAARPAHKAADGQVRKNASKFRVGGLWCEYPGDPSLPPAQRCRCRCVALTIPAD